MERAINTKSMNDEYKNHPRNFMKLLEVDESVKIPSYYLNINVHNSEFDGLVIGKDYYINIVLNPELYMSLNLKLSEEYIEELKTKNTIEIKNKSNRKVKWFLSNCNPVNDVYINKSLYVANNHYDGITRYMKYCVKSLGLDKGEEDEDI